MIRAFLLHSALSLVATAARTASTSAAAAGTAATTAAVVVVRRRASSGRGLSGCHRRALAVEVRLGALVELLAALLFVEVVSALDEDGALIRLGLPLVELMARSRCRSWSRRRSRSFIRAALALAGLNRSRLCQLGLLLPDERFAAELDAVAFNGQRSEERRVERV